MRKSTISPTDNQYQLEKRFKEKEKIGANNERKLRLLYEIYECYFCSSRSNVELHHIVPDEKHMNVKWSWGDGKMSSEIGKCVPLCKACHRKMHNVFRKKPIRHGTVFSHDVYGCNCLNCCKAVDRYKRYRARLAANARTAEKNKPEKYIIIGKPKIDKAAISETLKDIRAKREQKKSKITPKKPTKSGERVWNEFEDTKHNASADL